jgi:hypothetical protein
MATSGSMRLARLQTVPIPGLPASGCISPGLQLHLIEEQANSCLLVGDVSRLWQCSWCLTTRQSLLPCGLCSSQPIDKALGCAKGRPV